jgi:hypothetical protein
MGHKWPEQPSPHRRPACAASASLRRGAHLARGHQAHDPCGGAAKRGGTEQGRGGGGSKIRPGAGEWGGGEVGQRVLATVALTMNGSGWRQVL